jgi:mycothiol synthase
MTSSAAVSVVRSGSLSENDADEVRSLIASATAVDGVGPLSEAARLRLQDVAEGVTHLVLRRSDGRSLVGYAQLELGAGADVAAGELVISPDHRRAGLGRALLIALLEDTGSAALQVWAHGDVPGAARLAADLGFTRARELWQMRRPLSEPLPDLSIPDGVTLRTFEPGRDEQAWLALNASAFATHPEQGRWTSHDLQLREHEPWFDPTGFFLAERDGSLVGFHWTKIEATSPEGRLGEVYVLGVAPAAAGSGLGSLLTLVGLRHLQTSGVDTVLLYVEATNAAAIRVYERLGFSRFAVDVSYRTEPAISSSG